MVIKFKNTSRLIKSLTNLKKKNEYNDLLINKK